MVNREFIDREKFDKIDAELFNYFIYFSLIKCLISVSKQNKFISNVRKLLISIGEALPIFF